MKATFQTRFQTILRSSAAPCVLIVLLSIVLHAMSLPIATVQGDARAEYQTKSGLPYLSEMDSYLYARLTEDLAEEGFSAYTLRHDRGADPYISANATGEEGDVVMGLPILGATVYKLLSWIPGVTPYGVIYWLAPIITSLTAIPAYIFVKRRTNRLGGLVAGLLVAVAAPFAGHTHAGFYDTDLGLSLLPCLFLLCFAEALLTRDLKKQLAWAAGSGVSLCLLGTFWRAYYAYFCIGAAAGFAAGMACHIALLVFILRTKRKPVAGAVAEGDSASSDNASPANDSGKSTLPLRASYVWRGAGLTVLTQALLCLLVRGKEFFTDIGGIVGNVSGTLANGDAAFPDAARFVGELQPTPLLSNEYSTGLFARVLDGFAAYTDGVINLLGGWTVLLFGLGVAALLVVLCLRAVFGRGKMAAGASTTTAETSTPAAADAASQPAPDKTFLSDPQSLLVTSAFLFTWLACGLVIVAKGTRFLTIPVLPIGILCGIGVGLPSARLRKFAEKSETTDDKLAKKSRAIYIALLAVAVVTFAFAVRAEFGNLACGIIGGAILVLGLCLYRLRREALLNLFAVALVLSPCMAAFGFAFCNLPDGSDTLHGASAYIAENTPANAVVASWWDYGYYYEYAAKRLTLGDGGNFNSEWNYWLGQALMTDDDRLAQGIFGMLATGGLDATHKLMALYRTGRSIPPSPDATVDETWRSCITGSAFVRGGVYAGGEDTSAADELPETMPLGRLPEDARAAAYATAVLKHILRYSREQGGKLLREYYGLDEADAAEIVRLTYDPALRPIYLVISDDMIRKIGAIATYGNWGFDGEPAIPHIWQGMTARTVTPGTTVTFPLADSDYTVEVTRSADGRLTATFRNGAREALPAVLRVDSPSSPENSGSPANPHTMGRYAFDFLLPHWGNKTKAPYTIYLREDSENEFRCLVCSSTAAGSVLIRSIMGHGRFLYNSPLVYRTTVELPGADGTMEWHEVSVWHLNRPAGW